MNRSEKEALVASLRQGIEKAGLVVITRQSGLTVAEVSDLRRKMSASDVRYKVIKNTLARIAVSGTRYEYLQEHLRGPTAIAYSEDQLAAAKVSVEFAESNKKLEVVAGGFGEIRLSVENVKALAKTPSLEVLRARLLGVFMAPATKLAQTIQAPAAQLARIISAYNDKRS